MSPIRVVLIDDHPVVRDGIRAYLARRPNLEIVAEASDGVDAVRLARGLTPDVVLMDITLPRLDGIEATKQISRSTPSVKVILVTVHEDRDYVSEAMRAGASGYLLKDAPPAELVEAIERVHAGEAFHTSGTSSRLLEESRRPDGAPSNPALSDREEEILGLLVEGLTNRGIAERLGLSARTVESHRLRLRRKLGARSAAELARKAIDFGLVPAGKPRGLKYTDPYFPSAKATDA
jgi:two-component system nitrate/nitrite response regulator NarL